MPTVSVGRDLLFEAIGRKYTEEEFDELCFEFGIELDDVTTEKAIIRKEKHLDEEAEEDEEVIYKIEVPANRYDLLCLEGLARALRIFLLLENVPTFKLSNLEGKKPIKMVVKPETASIRPFVVCAILRGIHFTPSRYNSFIDLQDKLHQNICRKRSLVAIGTHDLDTLTPPFTYEAKSPNDIKFIPLKQTKEFTAAELMEFYKADKYLSKYLHIISDSPVFPVIYDSKGHVLSLPPIINGCHSSISLNTKNVFIECTATDLTKAHIVLNTIITMFSGYCEIPFEVEPVEIENSNSNILTCPKLEVREMKTTEKYINKLIGINLTAEKMVELLNRMQLPSKIIYNSGHLEKQICVSIPPTRSDILHPCDIMEDVAIAYGFNNIQKTIPKISVQGKQQNLNHFCDLLRGEIAQAGFTEILTWALISHVENFDMVNRKDDGMTAAVISNPRSADFEVVRSSLLPGILKTLAHNKDYPRPLKLFEISDVVLLDNSKDVGAKNERRLIAIYSNFNSGFEVIHGFVDRIMQVIGIEFKENENNNEKNNENGKIEKENTYSISESKCPEYFPGRQANILYKNEVIGTYGIVHPDVLARFDIPDPCSAVELNISPFL